MNDEAHSPSAPNAPSGASAKAKPAPLLRLSVLLEQVSPEHRYHVTNRVYDRLKDGTLPGVKLKASAQMDVPTVQYNGQPGRLTSPEVLLRNTPEARQQFQALADEVVRERLLRDGGRGLTSEDLDRLTEDDLELLMAQQTPTKKKPRR